MLTKVIDAQYRRPSGLLGRFIGQQMARDHRPENLWTVALLDAQPTDLILEIGFGAGVAIEELVKVVTEGMIAGIDYSAVMVRATSKRNAQALREGRVDLRCGEAAALPFADDHFDKAFSIHSIYFWPDPQAGLREIYRVLKPDGFLVLTILPKEKWYPEGTEAPVGTPECRPYSGSELQTLLSDAGFKATRIESDKNANYRSNYSVIAVK